MNNYNKYKDSLYGFIVGDALGVPVEFNPREVLKKNPLTEMVGYGAHLVPAGTWSDDTSMTLAAMDSISEIGGIDYNDIMNKFVNWVNKSDYTSTGKFFDIGISTRKAIANYNNGLDPLDCGGRSIYDNGNGSLMRILPFVIYSIEKKLSEEDEVRLINDASSITHAHEISRLGCKIYCDFIKCIFEGKNIDEAFDYLRDTDYHEYYSNESIEKYKRVLDGSIRNLAEDDILSNGYVVSTLEASLWALCNSNSYESAVLKAINLGSDTDTVGAITGSLAGAYYGNVPEKWTSKILNMELVNQLFDNFVTFLDNKDDLERKSL